MQRIVLLDSPVRVSAPNRSRRLACLFVLLLTFSLATVLPASSTVAFAQISPSIDLLRDLNTRPFALSPTGITVVGDKLFFVNDSTAGSELWVNDGSLTGTHLVKDIALGPADSNPRSLTAVGNIVFFTADDGIHGSELWASDGSEQGTRLIVDLTPGIEQSFITGLMAIDDTLFFFHSTPREGGLNYTLWSYGRRGLHSVKADIPSTGDTPIAFHGLMYFTIANELWRSDGTSAGTQRIATVSGAIYKLVALGPRIILLTAAIWQIWASDGTQAGTTLLPIPLNPTPFDLPVQISPNGNTLFLNFQGDIWQTDGTTAGSRLLASKPRLVDIDIREVGGVIYFGGRDSQNNSWELWRTDGTSAGTILLKALIPTQGFSIIDNLTDFNGHLFFLANTTRVNATPELWTSDGTVAGTRIFKDIAVTKDSAFNQKSLHIFANRLYFFASTAALEPAELWVSDGTANGTAPLSNTPHKNSDSVWSDTPIVPLNGALYMLAQSNTSIDLFRIDERDSGVTSVKSFPFIPGTFGGINTFYTNSLVASSHRLFFVEAIDSGNSLGFWTSDGTTGGTLPLAAISVAASLVDLSVLGDTMVAIVNEPVDLLQLRYVLWTSDGTPAGTVNQGQIASFDTLPVVGKTALNGKLYFLTGMSTAALWQTDGTQAGTTQVASLPGTAWSVSPPVVQNNTLFFVVAQIDRYELWTSDGTAAGTRVVTVLPSTGSVSTVQPSIPITTVGNTIFFLADDGVHGAELWASDGTAIGTRLVADINSGSGYSVPNSLANVYGTLLFSADDGIHGRELWASDGTATGTQLVADIALGLGGSNPAAFNEANGSVIFTASDRVTGQEPRKIAAPVGTSLQTTTPPMAGGAPVASALVPITYGNNGATKAMSLTLSITLGDGLAYLSDTSSISPTINGGTVTWNLPDTTFLVQRTFEVQVGTPDAPYGTRIPVDIRVEAQGVEATAHTEVLIARQAFLPIVYR